MHVFFNCKKSPFDAVVNIFDRNIPFRQISFCRATRFYRDAVCNERRLLSLPWLQNRSIGPLEFERWWLLSLPKLCRIWKRSKIFAVIYFTQKTSQQEYLFQISSPCCWGESAHPQIAATGVITRWRFPLFLCILRQIISKIVFT